MADDDWRFAVDEVGDASESAESDSGDERASASADGTNESGEPGVAEERPPLEPGSPSLENALFVLLGVFVTLLVIARVGALAVG